MFLIATWVWMSSRSFQGSVLFILANRIKRSKQGTDPHCDLGWVCTDINILPSGSWRSRLRFRLSLCLLSQLIHQRLTAVFEKVLWFKYLWAIHHVFVMVDTLRRYLIFGRKSKIYAQKTSTNLSRLSVQMFVAAVVDYIVDWCLCCLITGFVSGVILCGRNCGRTEPNTPTLCTRPS